MIYDMICWFPSAVQWHAGKQTGVSRPCVGSLQWPSMPSRAFTNGDIVEHMELSVMLVLSRFQGGTIVDIIMFFCYLDMLAQNI